MQMDDEVAHMGVVDGRLRLRLPGHTGRRVVRIDADDVELREVPELRAPELLELAAEDEMRQLLLRFGVGHRGSLPRRRDAAGGPSRLSARHGLDKPRMQPGGCSEELAVDRLDLVVARPRTLEGREPAAGFRQDEVGGGEVPVARIRGYEAEIDRSFGDAHETQRKRGNALDRAHCPDSALQAIDQRLRPGDPRAGEAGAG